MLQQRHGDDSGKLAPWMTVEDLSRLRAQLSPETQKRLETLPPAKQWELVANWIRQGQGMRHPSRGVHGPLPKASDDRLAEFFEKDLPEEERDRLLSLPGEEMQRELLRLFLRGPKPTAEPRFPPEDSDFGPWPGVRPAPRKSGSTSSPGESK